MLILLNYAKQPIDIPVARMTKAGGGLLIMNDLKSEYVALLYYQFHTSV